MSKKLNEWLDEFVENGADPSDVTAWPENTGSGGEEIITVESGDVSFAINPVELAKIAEQFDSDRDYSVIDEYFLDGSGNSGVSDVIYMDNSNNTVLLQIKETTVFEIEKSEFSTWSKAILDHADDFSSISYTPASSDGRVFVGIVRSEGHDIVGTFDLSKLLIEQEPQQEL